MSKEYCNAIDDECAFPSLECKQCLHGKSEAKEETEMDKITTEMVEHICDSLCRYRTIASQELMDSICEDCKIGKFVCDILNKYNHINDFSNSQCAKMEGHVCTCGNDTFVILDKGNNKGLYCAKCGKWHTWMGKNLLNLYEMNAKED